MNNHVAFGSFSLKINRLAVSADRLGRRLRSGIIRFGSGSLLRIFSLGRMNLSGFFVGTIPNYS